MFKSTRIKCAPIIFNFSLTARLRKKLSTLSAMLRYKKKAATREHMHHFDINYYNSFDNDSGFY